MPREPHCGRDIHLSVPNMLTFLKVNMFSGLGLMVIGDLKACNKGLQCMPGSIQHQETYLVIFIHIHILVLIDYFLSFLR